MKYTLTIKALMVSAMVAVAVPAFSMETPKSSFSERFKVSAKNLGNNIVEAFKPYNAATALEKVTALKNVAVPAADAKFSARAGYKLKTLVPLKWNEKVAAHPYITTGIKYTGFALFAAAAAAGIYGAYKVYKHYNAKNKEKDNGLDILVKRAKEQAKLVQEGKTPTLRLSPLLAITQEADNVKVYAETEVLQKTNKATNALYRDLALTLSEADHALWKFEAKTDDEKATQQETIRLTIEKLVEVVANCKKAIAEVKAAEAKADEEAKKAKEATKTK